MKLLLVLAAAALLAVPSRGDTYLVLPFANASSDSNLDWIGESVSEAVREALRAQGLVTLEREARQEAYRRLGLRNDAKLTRATVLKVGQALDAYQIIYGDFDLMPVTGSTASRGSLSISAYILDLRRLKKGFEYSETGALEDLAALQSHLAWQTLQFVIPNTAPSESDFRRRLPPVRVDAMENYIRGLLAPAPEQKLKLFTRAVRLEPRFSQAVYELGMLEYARDQFKTAAGWLAKIPSDDPHYYQASFHLGICRYETGDYRAAQAAFEVVAEAVPLNEVFNNLGAAQSRLNRPEAVDTFVKALEGDSADPVYHFNVGYALWKQGNFEAAAERFRAVLQRDPDDKVATRLLGSCLARTSPTAADHAGALERIKTEYEESAYRQLKAVLQPDKR